MCWRTTANTRIGIGRVCVRQHTDWDWFRETRQHHSRHPVSSERFDFVLDAEVEAYGKQTSPCAQTVWSRSSSVANDSELLLFTVC